LSPGRRDSPVALLKSSSARWRDEAEQAVAAEVGHVWPGGKVKVRARARVSVAGSEIKIP